MTANDAPEGLMSIGTAASPPSIVLPEIAVFANRSRRLRTLAPGHDLEPYLSLVASITQAQHEVAQDLGPCPQAGHAIDGLEAAAGETVRKLTRRLLERQLTPEAGAALKSLESSSDEALRVMVRAMTEGEVAAGADLARKVFLTAGLQVHATRYAASLDVERIEKTAEASCPVCGGTPMTSAVVGWPQAANTRFCTCGLCATMWHVVRIKCVLCGSTKGISYASVAGGPESVKAETCESCKRYVKILYQVADTALEPLADDVATLGLDLLLAESGWRRGGFNPFLLGY